MACVALTSLIRTIEIEFVQPTPRVRLYRLLIISILENLSCLQAFLQKESSGDGDLEIQLKDLEIQIREFALKAEDQIELQLSNILILSEGYPEKASHEELLHQTLQEAAKYTTELLESCVSEREMASVALSILIKKFKHYYLQRFPTMYGGDEAAMVSFLENLSSLRRCLLRGNSNDSIKKLETKIRIFALKAEDDIQKQLTDFLLAKDAEHEEEASQELRQTLGKAKKIAAELFWIMNKEKEREREREMTCNALTSLRKSIDEMEYKYNLSMASLLGEAKAGVKSDLFKKLSTLQIFLQKESNGVGGGAAMKDLETEIKHFALKAQDDIKAQLSTFTLMEDEEKASQKLHQTMQEAAESAEELLNIINCSRRRSNEEVVDDDDEANQTQPSNTWLRHVAANVEFDGSSSSHGFLKPEGTMVGRHHDCRVIKDRLFSSRYESPKLISIVGMVGIGKTTVARNVYEDASVALHFDVRGWVTIPQHYNKSRMLSDLLQSITPGEPNVIEKGSTPDELQMQVRKCLRGRKYLIVLDNIMSNQSWTDIRECVPDENVGSCILLTTRHFNQYTYWNRYVHHMTLLDPKESWELFCNILSIEEYLAPKFEKIRNHVVEKCDGLPQLIVEVAKRLSKCNNIQQEWKKIEKELESLGILDRSTISVNYNPLPHHLKVCFLYFGVFPKRYKILVKMLIRLWIAEGFVKPLKDKDLEDQAYEYLLELIDRSFLLLQNMSIDGKIKTCRMHSAMHSFCVVEAQKEALPELARFPSGLKKLKLSGTNISEMDLNVIAKLPKLMVLKLENAFHGTVWHVAQGGFCQLIFLLLEAKELKKWVVSFWRHFPKLRHLVLRSCNCLEQMPRDLKGYKLESIQLEGCHSSLVASAKQFQHMRSLQNLKIKILDPKYDESQNTHTKVSM